MSLDPQPTPPCCEKGRVVCWDQVKWGPERFEIGIKQSSGSAGGGVFFEVQVWMQGKPGRSLSISIPQLGVSNLEAKHPQLEWSGRRLRKCHSSDP